MITLAALEEIIDASGIAPRIEAMLPIGVRPRQLRVRTLLAGMCLIQADGRPAHLTRVHQVLTSLPEADQRRLGVITEWKHGPHLLTYRQAEYAFGLIADVLGKQEPDGLPSQALQAACDDLLEASIPAQYRDASRSLAVDWTDLESFSRPPPRGTSDCADPEASWGHRKNNLLRSEDELFYGYYLSAGIMMPDENGPAVPELARRATLSSCRHNPVRAFAPVLTAMPAHGIPLGDILDDSGYAHRDAAAWAIPLRAAARSSSRTCTPMTAARRAPTAARSSPTATCTAPGHRGRCWNSGRPPAPPRNSRPPSGNARPASWPATSSAGSPPTTPTATTGCSAPPRWARSAAPAAPVHDAGPGPARDPAAPGTSPGLLHPADPHRPARGCNAKTAQKHDYPSAAWRRSYARRTGAERGFATAKDPASNDISRGWCRLMGLAPPCCSSRPCSSSATSASWQPGTSGRKKPGAAPPPGCRPKPANGAARHSPCSPPGRHASAASTTTPADGTRAAPRDQHNRERQHAPKHARPPASSPGRPEQHATRRPPHERQPGRRNVRPKRENRPHRNVKTSLEPRYGIEP